MNTIVNLFTFFSRYTQRMGICAAVGFLAGAIGGLLLSFLDLRQGGLVLSTTESTQISLILTGFTWIVILSILCFLVKLTFRSVALPSLFNCLLTCFLTVYIAGYLNAFILAWLIGMIIGIFVGSILCRLNNLFG
ncbi:MAG: hypothetical protein AB8G15_08630 [Saprospiraceae bacterium]